MYPQNIDIVNTNGSKSKHGMRKISTNFIGYGFKILFSLAPDRKGDSITSRLFECLQ